MRPPKLYTALMIALNPALIFTACSDAGNRKEDPVEATIKAHSHERNRIMNKRQIEMSNDSNFTEDVAIHIKPEDCPAHINISINKFCDESTT